MELKIRKLAKQDLKEITRLVWGIYEEAKSDPNFGDYLYSKRPSKQHMKKGFRRVLKEISRRDLVYYVAEVDRKLVGYCYVRRKEPDSEIAHVGTLSIFVEKKYRGRGVGTRLLNSVIKACGGKFEILKLVAFSSNSGAKKLYRRLGFRTFGIGPRFARRGKRYFDREFMYLNL